MVDVSELTSNEASSEVDMLHVVDLGMDVRKLANVVADRVK